MPQFLQGIKIGDTVLGLLQLINFGILIQCFVLPQKVAESGSFAGASGCKFYVSCCKSLEKSEVCQFLILEDFFWSYAER